MVVGELASAYDNTDGSVDTFVGGGVMMTNVFGDDNWGVSGVL